MRLLLVTILALVFYILHNVLGGMAININDTVKEHRQASNIASVQLAQGLNWIAEIMEKLCDAFWVALLVIIAIERPAREELEKNISEKLECNTTNLTEKLKANTADLTKKLENHAAELSTYIEKANATLLFKYPSKVAESIMNNLLNHDFIREDLVLHFEPEICEVKGHRIIKFRTTHTYVIRNISGKNLQAPILFYLNRPHCVEIRKFDDAKVETVNIDGKPFTGRPITQELDSHMAYEYRTHGIEPGETAKIYTAIISYYRLDDYLAWTSKYPTIGITNITARIPESIKDWKLLPIQNKDFTTFEINNDPRKWQCEYPLLPNQGFILEWHCSDNYVVGKSSHP